MLYGASHAAHHKPALSLVMEWLHAISALRVPCKNCVPGVAPCHMCGARMLPAFLVKGMHSPTKPQQAGMTCCAGIPAEISLGERALADLLEPLVQPPTPLPALACTLALRPSHQSAAASHWLLVRTLTFYSTSKVIATRVLKNSKILKYAGFAPCCSCKASLCQTAFDTNPCCIKRVCEILSSQCHHSVLCYHRV